MISKKSSDTNISQRVVFPESVTFPKSWAWFMDQTITQWVKDRYSPRESWKGKPFSREDAHFFFRGIEELSEIFTQDRGRALQRYFEHPRFRSGYLLYFLPLQAAKFISVFNRHSKFLLEAIHRAKPVFRVADLGAGPLTASSALILWMLEFLPESEPFPEIEICGVDTHPTILKEGAELVELLGTSFPRIRGKIRITTHKMAWQEWSKKATREKSKYDLILMGHVLNEGRDRQLDAITELYSINEDAGILMVEPASKGSSQGLSKLRDDVFNQFDSLESQNEEEYPLEASSLKLEGLKRPSIVGPCPHFQACPLATGPDWCHFSFPAQVPGEWFAYFSKGLGSERLWLKFSYLWITPKSLSPSQLPLLISDALSKRDTLVEALICRPKQAEKVRFEVSIQKIRGPLGLRGGWLAPRLKKEMIKKDSVGPSIGANRKGRPYQAGKKMKGR